MKKHNLPILILIAIISVNVAFFQQIPYSEVYNDPWKSNEPKLNAQEIVIITPENNTYYKPMNGYYPATYGFENDEIGNVPKDWIEGGLGGTPIVIDSIDNHNKIVEMHDVDNHEINLRQNFVPQTTGIIEWWWRTTDPSKATNFNLFNSTSDLSIGLSINDGYFQRWVGGNSWVDIKTCVSNTWYHLRLDFDCNFGTNGQYNLSINGIYEITDQEFEIKANDLASVVAATSTPELDYYVYLDAVGYSWDPRYEFGDNLDEGLLISYTNSTILDWIGYSMNAQANKTLLGNTSIPFPSEGLHTIQVFGNNSLGTIFQSDVRYFSTKTINIITPENKTYTEPMSGYYPATYGFENDIDGSDPSGWTVNENGGIVNVISNIGGHNKIVELNDVSNTQAVSLSNAFTPVSSGTIEFWFRTSDTTKETSFGLQYVGSPSYFVWMFVGYASNNKWQYLNGVSIIDIPNLPTPLDNTWYDITIHFRCDGGAAYQGLSNNRWKVIINGFDSGELTPRTTKSFVEEIDIATDLQAHQDYYNYVDAVGYSWDPNYNIGDNLNEGLLLSYTNSTNLDWTGYSLDGQVNKTILGNTIFSFPSEGLHTIQVFGNDSLGTIYKSEMRPFSVDLLPIIIIKSPTQNDVIGPSAPYFNISIIESNLNETWYTLDNGASNITFNGLEGIINQTEWEKQFDGPITIRFYANDTSGLENFEEVIVIKDTSAPIISIISPNADDFFAENPPGFDITIVELSLNTTWYTLDNGASNITFNGLEGIINQTEWEKQDDGPITIRFYANDTFGNTNYAEITIFKDITDPVITIHTPLIGEEFTAIPPSFNISVNELNFESMWYTIDGGLSNHSMMQFTGYIESTAWNAAPIGAITIRFYAKDEAGNIGYDDIIVQKRSPPQTLDINLIIIIVTLISIIGIVVLGVIVYNKKHVRIRKPKPIVEKFEEKKKERKKRRKEKIYEPQIINCPYCQNKIASDQQYCIYCGANLRT